MLASRKTAVFIGVLFVIAFVLDSVGRGMYEPILNTPAFLAQAYPASVLLTTGLLLEFLAAIAIVLIPVAAYPIFKKHHEALALGYLGFRFLESILFMFLVINSLSLLSLSKVFVTTGAADATYLQTIGSSIQAQNNWATLIYIIVFTIGALIFNTILYQSKLIPRWIAVWGLIATALLLAGALVGLFDLVDTSRVMTFLGLPFALNEMVMAGWLLVKGFDSLALTSASGSDRRRAVAPRRGAKRQIST